MYNQEGSHWLDISLALGRVAEFQAWRSRTYDQENTYSSYVLISLLYICWDGISSYGYCFNSQSVPHLKYAEVHTKTLLNEVFHLTSKADIFLKCMAIVKERHIFESLNLAIMLSLEFNKLVFYKMSGFSTGNATFCHVKMSLSIMSRLSSKPFQGYSHETGESTSIFYSLSQF